MQPRWNEQWLEEYEDSVFLGGTNDVDLWIDDEGDLRLAVGEGTDGWDYWTLFEDGTVIRRSEDTDLTDEKIAQAFIYLNLFVPDWKEQMAKQKAKYRAYALG